MTTLLLLVFAVVFVLGAILWGKLHPFLALLLGALLVAALTSRENLRQHGETLIARGMLEPEDLARYVARPPVERIASAFGKTAGQVGVVIALASIIGTCLMTSGAATVIVDRTLMFVGMERAPLALAASSFVLGIPVFFDTVFYLMVPLARSLAQRRPEKHVLMILAIMAGGSIAHSLVPPTPGPLQVAAILQIDLVSMLVGGLLVGILTSATAYLGAIAINHWSPIAFRQSAPERGTEEPIDRGFGPDFSPSSGETSSGPPLLWALAPIVVPLLLLSCQAVASGWVKSLGAGRIEDYGVFIRAAAGLSMFLGDKNVALGVGTVVALALLRYAPRRIESASLVAKGLESAGVIILITSAGGAFGEVLGEAGVTEFVTQWPLGRSSLLILPAAFLLTAALRTIQGSATVAMITAAGMLQGFVVADGLAFHPVYVALVIGAGSKPIAWLNDSGFWLMCKMSGWSEREGLRTISPFTLWMGLSALFWIMLSAWMLPLR